MGFSRTDILELAKEHEVRFIRLQFTDILGVSKNVAITDRQLQKALDGEMMFDGSSIEGFVRIEESDMYLRPDLDTWQILPWTASDESHTVARLICDIYRPDGQSRITQCLNAGAVADVAGLRSTTDFLRHGFGGISIDIGHHNMRAFSSKFAGNACTKP